MRKELYQEIEVPQGVEVSVDGNTIKVKGPEGELSRAFNLAKLDVDVKDSKIIIGNQKATKTEKRMMNTVASHLKNMVQGVLEKFEYVVKVCSSHFPMTVDIQGKNVTVKNFLGEKIPRKTYIPEGAEATIDKDIITIKSCDKELAGQAAANLEKSTQVRGRDIRIFQDGLYIIKKAGKEI